MFKVAMIHINQYMGRWFSFSLEISEKSDNSYQTSASIIDIPMFS